MKTLLFATFLVMAILFSSCTPYYTWGYEPTIHPHATQAYIQAVLAKNNGDVEAALAWYDEALRYTWSDQVALEREQLIRENH